MEALRVVTSEGVRSLQCDSSDVSQGDTRLVLLGGAEEADREPERRAPAVWRAWARRELVRGAVLAMHRARLSGVDPLVAAQMMEPLVARAAYVLQGRR